jgi:predicted nucleotidyltransferase
LEAADFWSIGIVYMVEICNLQEAFKEVWDRFIKSPEFTDKKLDIKTIDFVKISVLWGKTLADMMEQIKDTKVCSEEFQDLLKKLLVVYPSNIFLKHV